MRKIVRKAMCIVLSIAMVICFLPGLEPPVYAVGVGDPCTIEVWAYNPSGSLVNTNSYKKFSNYKVGDSFNVHEVFLSMGASEDPCHYIGFVEVYGITDENVINNISGKNVTIAGAGESYVFWKSDAPDYTGFKLRLVIEVADTRKDITTCTFSDVPDHIYDGNEYKPGVTVRDGSYTLVENVDYELTYNGLYDAEKEDWTFTEVLPNAEHPTWNYKVYISGIGNWKNVYGIPYKILPADDSISFSGTSVTKTYGDAGFTKTVTKAQNGDGTVTYSSNNTNVATVNNSGQVTIKGAGNATITATATKTGTYNYPAPGNTASYTLTVNKATLTATANNKTITYGDAAPTYNISYSGWKGSDNASNAAGFTAPQISCEYAQFDNAGNYSIALSGGSARDYNITRNNGTLTVNKKPVTVTGAVAANKTYDGTTAVEITVPEGQIEGLVNEDEVTFESATGAFTNYSAGEGKAVTVTPVLSGEKAANYAPVHANITADIAKRDVTIKANDQTVELGDSIIQNEVTVVGGSLAAGDAVASAGLLPDEAQPALTSGTPLVISIKDGTVVIKKGGTTDVTANYNITVGTGALTVIPTRPNVDTLPTTSAITYGAVLSSSTFGGGKMVNKHDSTIEVEGTYAWKTPNVYPAANVDASGGPLEYTVVFTPNDTVNYSAKEFQVAVIVQKAELSVEAEDQTKTYLAADPELTYTVTGYQNGDDASVLSGALGRAAGEAVSETGYAINQGTLAPNGNYTISFTGAALTITKASQTAPAAGEGFSISNGSLDIADATNTAANNETHYEVTDDGGENVIAYDAAAFDIDPSKTYQIRWAGGDNYTESPWTTMKTTATILVNPSPAGAGTFTITGYENGVVPLDKTIVLEAVPESGKKFASWKKDGEIVSYDASYSFTVSEDATFSLVFVDEEKTAVKLPVMTADEFVYTGSEQTAVRIDSAEGFVLENHKATDAGIYTAVASLADSSFVWADGTTAPKNISWSIGKADLPAPTVNLGGGSVLTVTPPVVPAVQTEPLTAYYTQDSSKPKSEWEAVPEGGVEDAIGLYYFYIKGNNNYNDSPVSQKSGGRPATITTLQPTDLTPNSATINGSIFDPDSNLSTNPDTRVRFQWKATGDADWTELDIPTYTYGTSEPFGVTYGVIGLEPGSDYAFRMVVTLRNGNEVPGNTIKFRTPVEIPPSGSISVEVNSSPPGRDVVVSVEEGNDVIAAREMTTNATTTFNALPDGFFNVVVRSKDGKYVETRMIAIENGAGVTTVFGIPEGKLASTVEIKTEDTPPVAVEGLKDLITDSEKSSAASGSKNVEVELEVEKKAEAGADGSTAIKTILPTGKQVDMYLDLSLTKTTTNLDAYGTVTGVQTDDIGAINNVVLEIAIPYELAKTKGAEIEMFRYHDGAATPLTKLAVRPGSPFTDGTFYVDEENGYVFLYASGFSTYAIALNKSSHSKKNSDEVAGDTEVTAETPPPAKVADPVVTGVADRLITDEHIAYLSGYADGTVAPGNPITRAEVAMIFYRLLKGSNTAAGSFADVYDSAWYAAAVRTLAGMGILTGYEDGLFHPHGMISRAEFAAIATRFAKAAEGGAKFSDVTSAHWAYDNVATAADYGWVNGYSDGRFVPAGKISRAEVATIVNHMLGRSADKAWVSSNPEKIRQFSDLKDSSKWYYYDMVEATTEHDFSKEGENEKWNK